MFKCHICAVDFKSVSTYWRHCSRVHSNSPNIRFPCGIRNCRSTFSTQVAFRQHVCRYHKNEQQSTLQNHYRNDSEAVELKCAFESVCGDIFIDSLKSLVSHLKHHIRQGEVVQCPFFKCSGKFNFSKESSFAAHISRNHRDTCTFELVDSNDRPNLDQVEHDSSFVIPDSLSDSENTTAPINEDNCRHLQDAIERKLALIYLKLQTKHHIPSTVLQSLIDELSITHELNNELIQSELKKQLLDSGISEDITSSVINAAFCHDSVQKCHSSESGSLRSHFSRQKFYKDQFRYVPPLAIYLGLNSDNKPSFCHYVPILKSIQAIFYDETVINQYLSPEKRPENGDLHDFLDGKVFKDNILFNEQPSSLKLILYQDAFEVVNPLGSAKKKHKVLAVYFVLGNLHSFCRSKIDPVQLVLLCKERDFEFFGQEKIFGSLIRDLKILENDGINIPSLGPSVREKILGTVAFIAGDNLGSHCIGGFLQNFSTAHYRCRYCLVTTEEFAQAQSCCFGVKRDVNGYNAALHRLADNPDINSYQGVKFDSLFNQLSYFHVCSPGLPPCLAHDLFEGILHYDLALYFNYFISTRKWFSWNFLSRKFATFHFLKDDALDKPNVNDLKKGDKIGGQAIQTWCVLRFIALVIGGRIEDTTDTIWQNILLLQKIVQLILSPRISRAQVGLLYVYIQQYIETRISEFPEHRLKPKHHYLCHYPDLILQFGPLAKVWTLRFESKHSYFKKCARHCQNFKNITKTLSERHQLLQAFYSAGNLFSEEVEFSNGVPFHVELYCDKIKVLLQNCSVLCDGDSYLVDRIKVRGIGYESGSVLILCKLDYNLILGKISLILITPEKEVFFIVSQHLGLYVPEMNFYELCNLSDIHDNSAFQPKEPVDVKDMACLSFDSLMNYSSHQVYSVDNKNYIVLKHYV